jgi:hypothetical protein
MNSQFNLSIVFPEKFFGGSKREMQNENHKESGRPKNKRSEMQI